MISLESSRANTPDPARQAQTQTRGTHLRSQSGDYASYPTSEGTAGDDQFGIEEDEADELEENTIIALEKTFWFKGYDGDQIFFITTDTTPISAIDNGFCFPDILTDDAEECPDGANPASSKYFAVVDTLLTSQRLMFIKLARDMSQPYEIGRAHV